MIALLGACRFHHGGLPVDARGDAPPDAHVISASRRPMELVAGAGRLRAGAITIDVEVGQPVPLARSIAGAIAIEGIPVVKP